jgi:hypothetical protein
MKLEPDWYWDPTPDDDSDPNSWDESPERVEADKEFDD